MNILDVLTISLTEHVVLSESKQLQPDNVGECVYTFILLILYSKIVRLSMACDLNQCKSSASQMDSIEMIQKYAPKNENNQYKYLTAQMIVKFTLNNSLKFCILIIIDNIVIVAEVFRAI